MTKEELQERLNGIFDQDDNWWDNFQDGYTWEEGYNHYNNLSKQYESLTNDMMNYINQLAATNDQLEREDTDAEI
jgi:hypothetical protein